MDRFIQCQDIGAAKLLDHDTCTLCSIVKIDVKIDEDGGQTIIMRNVRISFSSRFKGKFFTPIPLKCSNVFFLRLWSTPNWGILHCLLIIILSCHFRPAQMSLGLSQPRSTLSSCDQTGKIWLLHLLHSFCQMFLLDMTMQLIGCFCIASVENPNLKSIDHVICSYFPIWFGKIYLILPLPVKLSFKRTHVINDSSYFKYTTANFGSVEIHFTTSENNIKWEGVNKSN